MWCIKIDRVVVILISLLACSFMKGAGLAVWNPKNPFPQYTVESARVAGDLMRLFFEEAQKDFSGSSWKRWAQKGDIYEALQLACKSMHIKSTATKVLAKVDIIAGIYQKIANKSNLKQAMFAQVIAVNGELQNMVGLSYSNPCIDDAACSQQWSLLKQVGMLFKTFERFAKEAVGGYFPSGDTEKEVTVAPVS